jgi:hypothetical protein
MGMGFSLKSISKFSLATVAVGYLSGCKLPEMKKDQPVMTKVAAQDVRDALWGELDKVDLHQTKVGQYAFYESNYRAESSGVFKFYEVERLVNSVDSTAESTKVVMQEALREYDNSGNITDEKLSDVIWTLQKEVAAAAKSFGEFNAFSNSNPISPMDYDYAEYYNLTTADKVYEVPAAVKARLNCGGFTNCLIKGREVSYLAHLIKDNEIIKRIQYRTVLSAEIPAIFWDESNAIWPVLSECMSHTINDIYVTECVVLRDAQK